MRLAQVTSPPLQWIGICLLLECLHLLAMFALVSEKQEHQKGDQGNHSDATDHDSGGWAAAQSAL